MSRDPVVRFRVVPFAPEAHLFRVEMAFDTGSNGSQCLTLPAWIPGSYMIRDFARNIVSLKAFADDRPIVAVKTDKQTWQVESVSGPLRIQYEIYANDLSVRSAHLDTMHGFFNGTSVFLRPVGLESALYEVELARPVGAGFRSWRLATTLAALDVDAGGFGLYAADTYADLIDHPVELADFAEIEFRVANVPHRLVITGRHEVDAQRLAQDLEKICAQHARLFDGSLPIERYLFLATLVGEGYGGLEHSDSCALIAQRGDLPRAGMDSPTEGYRRFLGLCSHEYFHLWNVKRITPQRLREADLTSEAHTELLWAFEGITSYYDDLALVRSACITDSSYLELFAQNVTRVLRGRGRFKQSVAESSFDAWTKFYKQDENAPNAVVSYYAKGSLVAFGLDMTLRDRSDDRLSLDDLMRLLWRRYGQPEIGVPEDGIQRLAEELLGDSLNDFFTAAVYGTDDLDLEGWLTSLGIGYRLRPANNPDDLGGVAEAREPAVAKPVLGARFKQSGDLVEITHVLEGGAAVEAGISAGDRLVALDAVQVNAASLAERLSLLTPGTPVLVHAFRRDELYQTELRPKPAPADTCDLWWIEPDRLTDGRRRRRESWLGRTV